MRADDGWIAPVDAIEYRCHFSYWVNTLKWLPGVSVNTAILNFHIRPEFSHSRNLFLKNGPESSRILQYLAIVNKSCACDESLDLCQNSFLILKYGMMIFLLFCLHNGQKDAAVFALRQR